MRQRISKAAIALVITILVTVGISGIYIVSAADQSNPVQNASSNILDSTPGSNASGAAVPHHVAGVVNSITCFNFSIPQTNLISLGNPGPSYPPDYVYGYVVTVSCSGCLGVSSDTNFSTVYSTITHEVAPQWNGTLTSDPGLSGKVSGVCDLGFGENRTGSPNSPWQSSWSFQKDAPQGILTVEVSLLPNKTVIYDKSTTSMSPLSGSFSTG